MPNHDEKKCWKKHGRPNAPPAKAMSNFTTNNNDCDSSEQTSSFAGHHQTAFTMVHSSKMVLLSNGETMNRRSSQVFNRLGVKVSSPAASSFRGKIPSPPTSDSRLKSMTMQVNNISRKRSFFDYSSPSSPTTEICPPTPGKSLESEASQLNNISPSSKSLSDVSDIELNYDEKDIEMLTNKELKYYANCFHSTTNLGRVSGWLVDSGASLSMTYDKNIFLSLTMGKCGQIKIANGTFIPICGYGTVRILLRTPNEPTALMLRNVAYVPALHINLISVKELNKDGYSILFEHGVCSIKIGKHYVQMANLLNNSYMVDEESCNAAFPCVHEWHRRLAHRNLRDIKNLRRFGMTITKCCCSDQCDACMKGKSTELPFQHATKPDNPLDIIVSDLCGPLRTQSLGGAQYFLTLTDVFSDYTEVKFLRKKDDAAIHVKDFVEFCKTQMSSKPKIFRSDGGGEYINANLQNFLSSEGIRIEWTTPNTPQQNGIAERKNRTLNDSVRTCLLAAKLPDNMWAEAMNYVVYTQNRIVHKGRSLPPIELFFRRVSKSTFFEFGRQVYVTTPKQGRGKLAPRAEVMKFLSVDDHRKGFRVWNGSKVVVTRNLRPKLDVNIPYEYPLTKTIALEDETEPASSSPAPISTTPNDSPITLRRSKRIMEQNNVHSALISKVVSGADPKTFKQAVSSDDKEEWMNAMKDELNSLQQTGTYELADLPEDKRAIGCKWVFKRKRENESIRYKARLVAKGFSQKFGEDYDEVFAPVARAPTIRLLLSMAGKLKLHVKQFDVKTAFLNGKLDEEIFMTQPEGFKTNDQVFRLKKSIYGLKQAARSWNLMLKECLEKAGFKQSDADDCFFVKRQLTEVCYIVVHVDDMLFAASSIDMIKEIHKDLSSSFELKDLGHVKQFLGVDIHRTSDGFYGINQSTYITKIANELGLDQAKAQKYPIQPGYFRLECDEILPTNTEYRKIIGMLLYISTNSRPDISLSVGVLAKQVERPRKLDFDEALRVVKYLYSTKDHILHLNNQEIFQSLIAFSDANHAECRQDGKSNSGILCLVNGGPIIWSSKKQSLVALSTCEAEYYAITETAKEVIWLRKLLESFNKSPDAQTTILTDNQSTISMITNGDFMQRTKYIGVRCHFIRDWIKKGVIELKYCPTEYNISDMMTKPLCGTKIVTLRVAAGLLPPSVTPSSATNSILSSNSSLQWNPTNELAIQK